MKRREWFDAADYWRELYLFMFSERRFAEAAEQVPKLLALANPAGKTVLDLGCGPGRFSIPLANMGFRVTGVDKIGYLLQRAKARAKSTKASVDWVRADMRDFIRVNCFDLALSMFTSFGYFADKQEDAQVLRNVFGSLCPGGSFVMDLMGKEVLARSAQPAVCEILQDGSRLFQRARICGGWSQVQHEWTKTKNGVARTFNFQTNIYSGQELAALLHAAGFVNIRLYGSLDGEEYGLNAKRLVVVGQRPASQR